MPTTSADPLFRVLVQLLLILWVAWGLGLIAERLGYTAVVGELLTGLILGPSVLGVISPSYYSVVFSEANTSFLDILALVGLILLLGMVGLEIDLQLIQKRLKSVATIGLLGMAFPFLIGIIFGMLLPGEFLSASASRLLFSLFVATALSISAIPVIARVLRDLGIFDHPIGQITIASAMFTDVIGWVILSVIAGIARSGTLDPGSVLTVIGILVGFILFALIIGQRVITALAPWTSGRLQPRSQLSFLIIVILASSALSWGFGLEPALGALVSGILVSRANAVIDSVKRAFESITFGFFAPIFFAIAGIRADLTQLLTPRLLLVSLALIVIATVGKFVGVYIGAILSGWSRWDSVTMGIGLNARGAIEIAIAALGLEFGILTVEMYTVVLVMAIATTVMTPPLLRRSTKLIGFPQNERDLD